MSNTSGTSSGCQLRLVSALSIVSLYKVGRRREAAALLPPFERLYMCVPDGRLNLLPKEREYLLCVKALLAPDVSQVITCTRDYLAQSATLVHLMGTPHLIESTLLYRLFHALHLAKAVASSTNPSESESFALHHRAEIIELIELLLTEMEKITKWTGLLTPLMERARGWLAHFTNDSANASYHLNRALLEARRLQLHEDEAATLELMAELQVPVLGADVYNDARLTGEHIKNRLAALFGCPETCTSPTPAPPMENV